MAVPMKRETERVRLRIALGLLLWVVVAMLDDDVLIDAYLEATGALYDDLPADHLDGMRAVEAMVRADMQREVQTVEWEYEATPDWKYGIRWTGKTLDEHLSNLERYSDPNGGWWYAEKEDKPTWITYRSRRRVKAGPWHPVTPSTPNQQGAEQ